LVPSSFEAQARRILEEVQSGSDEVTDGRDDDVRREQTREQPE
jgi:hypothetical protein